MLKPREHNRFAGQNPRQLSPWDRTAVCPVRKTLTPSVRDAEPTCCLAASSWINRPRSCERELETVELLRTEPARLWLRARGWPVTLRTEEHTEHVSVPITRLLTVTPKTA